MNTFECDTLEALKLEFWQIENELQVRREAQEKARKDQERLIMEGKLSEANAAYSVVTTASIKVFNALVQYIEDTLKPSRGKPSLSKPACLVLKQLDGDALMNVVADCIAMCLNGVGVTSDNALIHSFGKHIEHEFMLKAYREEDREAAKFLKQMMSEQAQTTNQRYRSVEYSLSANRLQWAPWREEQVVIIGQILYHLIVTYSDMFDVETVTEVFY